MKALLVGVSHLEFQWDMKDLALALIYGFSSSSTFCSSLLRISKLTQVGICNQRAALSAVCWTVGAYRKFSHSKFTKSVALRQEHIEYMVRWRQIEGGTIMLIICYQVV